MKRMRQEVLSVADNLINGSREQEYGSVLANFTMIAQLWETAFGWDADPAKVALAMDLVKTARLLTNPQHFDSWTDKAGYAALGAEVACDDR